MSFPSVESNGETVVVAEPDATKREGQKGRGRGKKKEDVFDPAKFVTSTHLWWFPQKNIYYMPGPNGEWMRLTKSDLELWLQGAGLRCGTSNEPIMEVEKVILWTQGNRQLDGVMCLAGHFPGVEASRP